jgi:hypothetical protein
MEEGVEGREGIAGLVGAGRGGIGGRRDPGMVAGKRRERGVAVR